MPRASCSALPFEAGVPPRWPVSRPRLVAACTALSESRRSFPAPLHYMLMYAMQLCGCWRRRRRSRGGMHLSAGRCTLLAGGMAAQTDGCPALLLSVCSPTKLHTRMHGCAADGGQLFPSGRRCARGWRRAPGRKSAGQAARVLCVMHCSTTSQLGTGNHVKLTHARSWMQAAILGAFENFARRFVHQFPGNRTAQVTLGLMLRRRAQDGTHPMPQALRRHIEKVRSLSVEYNQLSISGWVPCPPL